MAQHEVEFMGAQVTEIIIDGIEPPVVHAFGLPHSSQWQAVVLLPGGAGVGAVVAEVLPESRIVG